MRYVTYCQGKNGGGREREGERERERERENEIMRERERKTDVLDTKRGLQQTLQSTRHVIASLAP